MTNRTKHLLAVLLTLTFPVWVVPVLLFYIVFGVFFIIYAGMCDALGVKT